MQAAYQGFPKDGRIMPMPSIPPPVRREIDTPVFDHRRYLPGPTTNNRRITPLPTLPRNSSPPLSSSPVQRRDPSPGSAIPGPSRFPGSYEDNKDDVYEVCNPCKTIYSVQEFEDHICNPRRRHYE
ncbi:hypothetical protein M422DRAFT_261562 [Sphaerobolus stellatus SS14]|uniref:Uncharacterized protein n=1 Tax=Sphaerobolus stellatus (strain SS14) TaxID=990650 RepID=A0A0C9U021_SPHS4|nr:hypothetical protein M422DRAFT_261562 [Sphaerobolus stellatus SS14]